MEKREVERSEPHMIRPRGKRVRKQWDYVKIPLLTTFKTPLWNINQKITSRAPQSGKIVHKIYPYKLLLYLCPFTCLASGPLPHIFCSSSLNFSSKCPLLCATYPLSTSSVVPPLPWMTFSWVSSTSSWKLPAMPGSFVFTG